MNIAWMPLAIMSKEIVGHAVFQSVIRRMSARVHLLPSRVLPRKWAHTLVSTATPAGTSQNSDLDSADDTSQNPHQMASTIKLMP